MTTTRIRLTVRQAKEFLLCHLRLYDVLFFLADAWPVESLIVTSIHRTPTENLWDNAKSQIHVTGPPYRAIDVGVMAFADPQGTATTYGNMINEAFEYDSARPALKVAVTEPHGTGPHIHIQVHANTRRRGV